MLGVMLILWLVGVLRQPLLAPLLWPAIPLAVVGLWRDPPRRIGEVGQPGPVVPPARKPGAKRGKRR